MPRPADPRLTPHSDATSLPAVSHDGLELQKSKFADVVHLRPAIVDMGRIQWQNAVTNKAEADRILRRWAGAVARHDHRHPDRGLFA